MMKPIYIHAACAISPQHSFDAAQFLQPVVSTANGMLFAQDADYRSFISPVAIRRMSRLIKMGISTGMRALQTAGVATPDAIITGTGLGSMTDMEHFLKDMIALKEEALNPTYFIQSTYNSINGWLALQSKCTGYNQTYVNRGASLELSLLDAQLLLNEDAGEKYVLVGSFDELTPDYFAVKGKIGYWKKEIPPSHALLQHDTTPGTIAGEGTAFFVLSNVSTGAVGRLLGLQLIQSLDEVDMVAVIQTFLAVHGIELGSLDLVLCGNNGDARFAPLYSSVADMLSPRTTLAGFKHLCGEYPTASGFALWLSTHLLQMGSIPPDITLRKGSSNNLRYVLLVNHYILGSASLLLLELP